MPHIAMRHDVPPEKVLLKKLGDISELEIFNNQVLVAVYVRPVMTAGGIELPGEHVKEDEIQSKVGLVIKMGAQAFDDPSGRWFKGSSKVKVGDWIIFRPTDGWPITVNKTVCRFLDDTNIRGRVPHPDSVW